MSSSLSYWLMKTEPDKFSFEDLVAAPHRTEGWDGVRNYQARNAMRDDFSLGDKVFIYHSRIKEPAVVGVAEVVRTAYPDMTALDPNSPYFDPKSREKGESRWVQVDVKAVARFKKPVTLGQMRNLEDLQALPLLKKGQRLSIQPVGSKEWQVISKLGQPVSL